jgi:hypothetical protein
MKFSIAYKNGGEQIAGAVRKKGNRARTRGFSIYKG